MTASTVGSGTSATSSTIDVGGATVTMCRLGRGDPVVYLHGLCDVHAVYGAEEPTPFLTRLAEHRELLAPALPGYNGSTGLDPGADVEDAAWNLADLFDALEVDSVDVVAHSLGGWLATELALRHPMKVRRLVLVAPLGLHVPGVDIPPFFGAAAPRGVGGMSEVRRLLFAHPEDDVARRALPDAMDHDVQLRWFGGLAGAARLGWKAPHFQSRKLARRLVRLRVPTSVVHGEDDVLVPPEVAQAWADVISGARRRSVPGAGHCVPLEQPDIAAEVLALLSDPETGRG